MLERLSIERVIHPKYTKLPLDRLGDIDRSTDYINHICLTYCDINRVENKWVVHSGRAKDKVLSDGHLALASKFNVLLDACAVQSYYLLKQYKAGGFKNFIPSIPLIEVLSNIEVDMKSKLLVDGTKGHFELSSSKIRPPTKWSTSSFISNFTYMVVDRKLLLLIQFDTDSNPATFNIDLENCDNLEEGMKGLNFNQLSIVDGKIGHKDSILDDTDVKAIRLMFNLIVYVNNPNEEFKSEFNKFSTNSKHKNRELLEYTQKPFVKIGFDAEFLRLITTETFDVRAHWRWQPCGVGRMSRKLTFIKPHTRSQKRFNDVV